MMNPTKIFFIFSLVCILLIVPFRLTCNTDGEDVLVVLSIILECVYFLYFARCLFCFFYDGKNFFKINYFKII